jgi:hypothetical protein
MLTETMRDLVDETDMLSSVYGWEKGNQWEIGDLVRASDHLPAVIWIRMQQMERIQRVNCEALLAACSANGTCHNCAGVECFMLLMR